MIGELINIGDKLVVKIEKESREWGYNPCKDGTIVEAIGFSEICYGHINNYGKEPGVYDNYCWVKVQNEHKTWFENHSRLSLVDHKEQKNREKDFKTVASKKLRDLPFTDFFEDDIVYCSDIGGIDIQYFIHHIHWDYFVFDGESNYIKKCDDGVTDMPTYAITECGKSGYTSVRGERLQLIERGNVWKYYNGEKIEFADLLEEANFAMKMGKITEVKNPNNNLYRWSLNEVLEQIRNGLVDGFYMNSGLLGLHKPMMTDTIIAIKFKDDKLGKRVAEKTLEEFS